MSSTPQFGKRVLSSQTNADNIRTAPSPSFDPKMIDAIEGIDDTNRGYVSSAREAFAAGQKELTALWQAMREVSQSTAWSQDRQLVELAGAARRVQDRVLKAFQSATDTLTKGITHLEGELNKPFDSGTTNTPQAGELRLMLRKEMTEKERADFIATAIETNETRVIHAVLGAVPALSGLHPSLHANYVRLYREKNAPGLVKRLSVMRAALAHVERIGPVTFNEVATVLHQLMPNNVGPMGDVWGYVERIETKYKAAKVALDKIP